MIKRAFFAVVSLVSLAAGVSVQAQSPSALVGKWNIDYERGRRIENDVVTPVMAKGVLTIVSQGDSLIATLQEGPRQDGTPTPPRTISGRVTNGKAVFVQKQEVRINMNGEERMQPVIVTWTLSADGNALSGSMAREMPGMNGPMEPSAVKGTRAA